MPRNLLVSIHGSFPTFFMKVFGMGSLHASAASEAEYVLPVPMGSPENYYGVFGQIRTPAGGTTETSTTSETTDLLLPTTAPSGNWTNPARAQNATDGGSSATKASTTSPYQAWSGFNVPVPGSGSVSVTGIELQVRAASSLAAGCVLRASLSWNAAAVTSGTGWTSTTHDITVNSTTQTTYTVGGAGVTWGRSWTASTLSNTAFRVRLEYRSATGCSSGWTASVDALWIRIYWDHSTSTFVPDQNVAGPGGQSLSPRGFWGAMNSEGSESINGDAYLAYYDTRTSAISSAYNPSQFYDYAIEMPPGSAGGTVWVYDPAFCATDGSGQYGTGDRWFSGTTAVSAFYTVYDTMGTPYDLTDDQLIAQSGNLFRDIQASDQTLGGPTGVSSCADGDVTSTTDGRYWHDRWYPLATGLIRRQ